MGMDGEEEEIFFWIHHQLAVLSVRAGLTEKTPKNDLVDLFIWIDVTVTHRAIIWPLLPFRERGSLVPFMSTVLSHKCTAVLQPQASLVLKEGKKGYAVEKVPLPVASWHTPHKCLREGELSLVVNTSRSVFLLNE